MGRQSKQDAKSECAYLLSGGNRGEVLLPFHGHQVLFLGVAFLAAGHNITFGTFASPGNRHNMVHGEFSRGKISVAIDGVYEVTLADLQKAGLSLENLDSSNLELTKNDSPIPGGVGRKRYPPPYRNHD